MSEKIISESIAEAEKQPRKVLKGMPEFLEMHEDREQLEADKHPDYLMMNLETSCSYKCIKCAKPGSNRKMGQPLSINERKNVLDMATDVGIKELVIVGAGEPSSTNNFEKIVRPVLEATHERGMGTVMFTTGFGIDREQAEFYRDNDVTVFISLDSLDPDIYKKLTGTGDLYKVLKNN